MATDYTSWLTPLLAVVGSLVAIVLLRAFLVARGRAGKRGPSEWLLYALVLAARLRRALAWLLRDGVPWRFWAPAAWWRRTRFALRHRWRATGALLCAPARGGADGAVVLAPRERDDEGMDARLVIGLPALVGINRRDEAGHAPLRLHATAGEARAAASAGCRLARGYAEPMAGVAVQGDTAVPAAAAAAAAGRCS